MNFTGLRELNQQVEREAIFLQELLSEIRKVMVGQDQLLERVLIGLLADGHILLEGVPGLAKTLLVTTLAQAIDADFSRIQFTPDLLPADLIGTQIYNPRTMEFTVHKGPIFANLVLTDEINRAPEQEGTYPLPEAQIDRFMLKVLVDYPSRDEERRIVDRMTGEPLAAVRPVISTSDILNARKIVRGIYVDDKVKEYVMDLVVATREPSANGIAGLGPLIAYGASPRASIYLIIAARAHAFLKGRGYVTPEDIKELAPDILRHRLIPTYEAEAQSVTASDIVQQILDHVQVP